MFSAFFLIVFGYIFIYEFKHIIIDMIYIPVKFEFLYIFLLILLICVVNPIAEEWFWRLFLIKTMPEDKKSRILININYTLFHFITLS